MLLAKSLINSLFAGLSCFFVVFSSADYCRADVITGDQYDVVIGGQFNGGGFGFNLVNGTYGGSFTFDGVAETMGTDFSGGVVSINESVVDNGNDTRTLSINLSTTGTDMFPTSDGMGTAITAAGWFMGTTVGGNNLDFVGGPPTLVTGEGRSNVGMGVFGFDNTGTNIWGFSLAGGGTAWDGTGGFNLAATPVGQGTTSILFEVNYAAVSAVPEPSSLGLMAFGAIGFVMRRRRRVASV